MSSTLTTAHRAILQRIETAWAARTPVAWPNVEFTPPDPSAPENAESAVWLQVSILWGDGAPGTMGAGGQNDVVGVLQFNIFAPKGRGGAALTTHADAARDVANRLEVGGVRFGAPSGPTVVPVESSGWAQVAVRVPFTVLETV